MRVVAGEAIKHFIGATIKSTCFPLKLVRIFLDYPDTAMDEQQYLKKCSLEARSKRRLILNQKRPSRSKISTEGENMPRHTNDGNHLSGPAMYVETSTHSMSTPLSYYSKEQETSFINRNISTARLFGRTLVSGGHTIGENHHVSPGESEIRSITHLEGVKGRKECSSIAMKMSFPPALNSSLPYFTSNGLLASSIPNLPTTQSPISIPSIDINSSDVLIRRAAMYQDYMEQIPIPSSRGSVIPFTSWMGLGQSIKKLYGQPLHYLTNIILKQWDQMRIGSEDEYRRLDDIIHPCKAEATIWLMEQVHRQASSHFHLANLWKKDPMYNGFLDSIFPTLQATS
ncbi:uncharacterized protein [Medicago truncatula]|nr:uncharacterized protein LOC11441094 isoform X3 [Medicago truncatula]